MISWRKHFPQVFLIVFILLISISFFVYSPQQIVADIGVKNAYVVIAILSFLGGLSTFTGIPYHWVLGALAIGGANPFLLGLTAGLSVALGDTVSYFVGYEGSEIIPEKIRGWLVKLFEYGSRHPKLLPLVIFAYGSLMPTSNDFIVVSSGLVKYPYWKVMLPLTLGNITFNTWLAFAAVHGYEFFINYQR